jgi:phospholipid/cholesterol/gamma-HCH transport system substrate-binding protein
MTQSRRVREGSVGLLIILGLSLLGTLILWLKGIEFGKNSYKLVLNFANAASLQNGTPVRYRGIQVGKVTDIKPQLKGVAVTVEIESVETVIPRNVLIEANLSGIVGAAFIDITPQGDVPSNMVASNPVAKDCPQDLIICHNDELNGVSGASFQDLIQAGLKITNTYNDPQLVNNIKSIVANTTIASAEASKLTRNLSNLSTVVESEIKGLNQGVRGELGILSKSLQTEVGGLSNTFASNLGQITANVNTLTSTSQRSIESVSSSAINTTNKINQVADDSQKAVNSISTIALDSANAARELMNNANNSVGQISQSALETSDSIKALSGKLNLSADQVNTLINDNSQAITTTLDNINQTSLTLKEAMEVLKPLMGELENSQIISRLDNLSNNAVETSANLRQLSVTLTEPNNIMRLQETLNVAETTLNNIQKITADLNDLTGDENLRNNIKRVINGMGNLFSATQELQQQTRMTQKLDEIVLNKNLKYEDLVNLSKKAKQINPDQTVNQSVDQPLSTVQSHQINLINQSLDLLNNPMVTIPENHANNTLNQYSFLFNDQSLNFNYQSHADQNNFKLFQPSTNLIQE